MKHLPHHHGRHGKAYTKAAGNPVQAWLGGGQPRIEPTNHKSHQGTTGGSSGVKWARFGNCRSTHPPVCRLAVWHKGINGHHPVGRKLSGGSAKAPNHKGKAKV